MTIPEPLDLPALWAAPEESLTVTESIIRRFWAKVQKTEGCWFWIGAHQDGGYGYLHRGSRFIRKPLRAHRVSWELHHGPIPEGSLVLHRCDVPSCVNPDHLFLGDCKTNMKDAVAKGRHSETQKSCCPQGHPYTHIECVDGRFRQRRCRACVNAKEKRRYWARKNRVAP